MLKHFMNQKKNLLPLLPGFDLPGYNTDEREENEKRHTDTNMFSLREN